MKIMSAIPNTGDTQDERVAGNTFAEVSACMQGIYCLCTAVTVPPVLALLHSCNQHEGWLTSCLDCIKKSVGNSNKIIILKFFPVSCGTSLKYVCQLFLQYLLHRILLTLSLHVNQQRKRVWGYCI